MQMRIIFMGGGKYTFDFVLNLMLNFISTRKKSKL